MFLSLDPGLSTGFAWWSPKLQLVACGVRVDGPGPAVEYDISHLIIECPRIYTARLMKGDPNNIVTLAVQVGRYIERYGSRGFTSVFPGEWKQQQSKGAHHPKIFKALSPVAQEIVRKAGKGMGEKALGDMFDAIGLGQYAITMGIFK
jgi:hypothetical protein